MPDDFSITSKQRKMLNEEEKVIIEIAKIMLIFVDMN